MFRCNSPHSCGLRGAPTPTDGRACGGTVVGGGRRAWLLSSRKATEPDLALCRRRPRLSSRWNSTPMGARLPLY